MAISFRFENRTRSKLKNDSALTFWYENKHPCENQYQYVIHIRSWREIYHDQLAIDN